MITAPVAPEPRTIIEEPQHFEYFSERGDTCGRIFIARNPQEKPLFCSSVGDFVVYIYIYIYVCIFCT